MLRYAARGVVQGDDAHLSSRHMNLFDHAAKIEKAALTVNIFLWFVEWLFMELTFQTIAEGKAITGDLGGKASTKEYTDAIIQKLRKA